jgi:CubicO group peptidase (beta-lactamase class C family)
MRLGRYFFTMGSLVSIAMTFIASCSPQATLTHQRIRAATKGLMRVVYLKGLRREKLALADRMTFYKVPGVSIAAIDHNRLEWTKAFGTKDRQIGEPLAPDTLFQGGALSQMIAAAAAFKLAEQGRLDLDADVWPKFHDGKSEPSIFAQKSMTARSLLTHSADLSDQAFPGYSQEEALPSLMQIIDGEKPAKNALVLSPATKSLAGGSRYSESGYVIVQRILEEIEGKPFQAIARELIFDPLRLKNSSFEMPLSDESRARAAPGHLQDGKLVPGLYNNYPESAALGLWTTSSDYALFLSDLLQSAESGSGKILSQTAARSMLRAQAENFGPGFMVEGTGDNMDFYVRAKTRGYAAFMTIFPAKGQGAVIMANSANGGLLIQEILCGLSEAYGWPHYKPEEKTVLRLTPEAYRQYVGKYEVNPDYVLDVAQEDYYLVVQPTGQAPTKFYAESQTLFYATDPYIRIQFLSNKQGVFDSLVLWQEDFELQAKKVR